MRVITGSARGRVLESPAGLDVRPTVDRVKEAVFSIIQFEIEGRSVLDLFAGSGQLGIEALSRGAKSATFVDKDKSSVEVVTRNVAKTGFERSSRIVCSDSFSFLMLTKDKYDIVFLDPPYGSGLLQKAIPLAAERMNPGGVMVCESPYGEELPEQASENYSRYKTYKYGKTAITVYRYGG